MDPILKSQHVELESTPVLEQQVSIRTRKLSSAEQNVLNSINQTFLRWREPWRKTYLEDGREFISLFKLMEDLLHYEQQLTDSDTALPLDRTEAIAKAVARLIDYGNAILNIDLILRPNNDSLGESDPHAMTTIALFQAHKKAYRLREKLLYDYFRKDKPTSLTHEETILSSTPNGSFQFVTLQIPTSGSSHSLHLSPTLERSHRSSIGSSTSINASTSIESGRRTPQNFSGTSHIELKPVETELSGHIEVVHMTATIRSNAFLSSSPTRIAFLPGILTKIEELMSTPTTVEKLNSCFELTDALLDTMERVPNDLREKEVLQIAMCLMKPIVRKVYIEDRSGNYDSQHTHWTTLLVSIIKLMSATDFNNYLRNFPKLTDLATFLKDYLFIIKRFISANSNQETSLRRPSMDTDYNNSSGPTYPSCWIEMRLLACSTFLKSLTHLYQTVKQLFSSNLQMWSSYIDCLVHFILHDTINQDRLMHKERQRLIAHDLRKISAEYVWISWNSLKPEQKQLSLIEDLIEPLLKATMVLSSQQRSILLPIFYDMMRCDYIDQYITPRGPLYNPSTSISSSTFGYRDSQQMISSNDDDLESLPPIHSQPRISITPHHMGTATIEESLPYLSVQEVAQNNQDGTVLTKFTHLLVGKLNTLMIDLDLGDESFKIDLCTAIAGDLRSEYSSSVPFSNYDDSNQFKCMARQTSDLIAEFIQICLDSRQANKLAYKHLYLLCLFKLVLFFRDKVDRTELYLLNLYKLCYLHHSSERYVEAGYTLLEHAKSLPWSDKPLESYHKMVHRYFMTPNQLNDYSGLKIFLYNTIIEYFDRGQIWEPAIPLCRELMDLYQFKTFEYGKLSQLFQKMSIYFSNIVEASGSRRGNSEYFRVTFYGDGFPSVLRNTTMVYRGKPFEKLGDFQSTMLTKYPDAELLKSLAKPDDLTIMSSETRLLQINACTPVVDLKNKLIVEDQVIDLNKIDSAIVHYYRHNECDKFTFSRRLLQHGDIDNFANMWREKTSLTTNTLPGMLPFFPAYLIETSLVSPIETAIEDLERTNERLANAVKLYRDDKGFNEDIRSLGQLLLGVVDAAVNGGITKYEEAFLSHKPLARQNSNQQDIYELNMSLQSLPADGTMDNQQVSGRDESLIDRRLTSRIKSLIAQQIPLLDEAIKIHGSRVAEVMRPQHQHLELSYKKLKHHIISKYSRYLPPEYNRHSSTMTGSIRSLYRSTARSPSRSMRIDTSRHMTPPTTGVRMDCKRMSDVSSPASRRAIAGATQMERANDESNHTSSIPYKQLSNERRSLPFLTGVPLVDREVIRDSIIAKNDSPTRYEAPSERTHRVSSTSSPEEATILHSVPENGTHKYHNLATHTD